VATLWLESRGRIAIVTGYALSGGLWRQHSWGLEGGTVIETTVRRTSYYGLELGLPDALRFACGNPPHDLEEVHRTGEEGAMAAHVVSRLTGHPYETVLGSIRPDAPRSAT
jgi:hypothetical protein